MKKILLFLLSLTLCTSCLNDFLDVQPVSDISTATFWKTESDARAALNSVYRDMQSNFSGTTAGNWLTWYEARSDNFVGTTISSGMPTAAANLNRLNSSHPGSNWNTWYKSVSTVNYALYYLPQMTELTEVKKNQFLAEAYTLRAYLYFSLVRIWGDVPLVLKPTLTFDDVEKPTQAPQAEVLAQVKKDLDEAIRFVDVGANELFFFSVGSLYSLYTDYAMWMRDYQAAERYSGLLMDLNRYSLVPGLNFAKVCSEATTSENIWTLKWLYENNGTNYVVYQLCRTSAPQLILSNPLKELWLKEEYATDMRRYQTIDTAYVYSSNHIDSPPGDGAIWKWMPEERMDEINDKYIPMYRYADVLLLRAEALNRLSRHAEALELLNLIRERAGIEPKGLSDYNGMSDLTVAIEDDILQERQFELIGEGKRWFDLVRTGRAMRTMNSFFENYIEPNSTQSGIRFTENWQLYWPVYYNNILENENLKQNGDY